MEESIFDIIKHIFIQKKRNNKLRKHDFPKKTVALNCLKVKILKKEKKIKKEKEKEKLENCQFMHFYKFFRIKW